MDLLKGFTIIDFTRLLPGPLATHLLAQMGATVIKIESPKRMDYARASGPMIDGASTLFHQLNHNKQLLSIDYTEADGKATLLEYIQSADVLIEQFRPGAMTAWGLGYEAIKTINPGIVYVSLTGYGQESIYHAEAGHDFNYLAYAGLMSLLRDDTGKPVVPGFQLADISGAYMAVMALQAALLKKQQTGLGSFVDVALCDATMPFLTVPYSLHSGGLDHQQFNILNGRTAVNYAAYECADGKWLSVSALETKFWNNLCEVLDQQDWKRNNQMELMAGVFPKQEVVAMFKTQARQVWIERFEGKDVCVAPILEINELESSAYHQDRGTFEAFETPKGTSLKTISLPFRVN